MELLIRFLPIIFRLINMAPQIQEAIRTGVPTVKAVEQHAGDLLPILAQVGKQLFPDVDDKLAPAAAATAMFDPVRVKWLQTALNLIGTQPPLDVDGEYGPLTAAAVKQFQETHGLVADGWAGDVTHAALQAAVAKAK
jgi:peptidoglycan hydrolase-like protein with peptidoglycan-binding domain